MPKGYAKNGNINAAAAADEDLLDEGAPGQGNIGNQDRLAQAAVNQDEEQEDFSQHDAQFESIAYALRTSKKGGLGIGWNSKNFRAVDDALQKILDLMNVSLDPADPISTSKILLDTMRTYNILIDACEKYVGDRKIRTDNGKKRRTIVNNLKDMAKKDVRGFLRYFDKHSALPQEQRAKSVKEVLEKSRRRVIQLNTNESDLKHVGGAISYIAVINEENTEAGGKASGFFKEEDILEIMEKKSAAMMLVETIGKRKQWRNGLVDEIKAKIEDVYQQKPNTDISCIKDYLKVGDYFKDIEYHNFVDEFATAANGRTEAINHMGTNLTGIKAVGNKIGDNVNMSNRNVAASRLAEMLGVGNLIAHSETAELHDMDGTVKKGNLMQKANGIEFAEAMQRITKDDYDKGTYFNDPEHTRGLEESMTPEFVKSMVSLQVLDNLMGQMDRHTHNFFVDFKDNKLGGVQGIDNDFAFGHTLSTTGGGASHARNILNKELAENDAANNDIRLSLKYMDKALADNILALKETDVRMMFYDILEGKAIDVFCKRLKYIQEAIIRAKEEETVSLIEKDEDWTNEEVLNSFLDKANGEIKGRQETYLGQVRESAKGNDKRFDDGVASNHEIKTKEEAKKAFMEHAKSPEDAINYIKSFEQNENMCGYYKVVLNKIWNETLGNIDEFKKKACAVLNINDMVGIALWQKIGETIMNKK